MSPVNESVFQHADDLFHSEGILSRTPATMSRDQLDYDTAWTFPDPFSDTITITPSYRILPFGRTEAEMQVSANAAFSLRDRPPFGGQESAMCDQIEANVVTVAQSLARAIQGQIWRGSGYNAKEMIGLDRQIRSGVPDAASPFQPLKGTISRFQDNGLSYDPGLGQHSIPKALLSMYEEVLGVAIRSHLYPASWIIAMRPELWYEITCNPNALLSLVPQNIPLQGNWTCSYCGQDKSVNLTACVGGCGGARDPAPGQYICLYCGRVYFDYKTICWDSETGTGCGAIDSTVRVRDISGLAAVVEGRSSILDWIFNEQKLILHGSLVDVITDYGIGETHHGGGVYSSPVYFIPTEVCGRPSIRMDYWKPDREPSYWGAWGAPGGRYLAGTSKITWSVHQDMWDFDNRISIRAITHGRVSLLAPQLAGVIDHVPYRPGQGGG